MKKILFIFFVLTQWNSIALTAQTPVISGFKLQLESDKYVHLYWTVEAGQFTCNDLQLQWSTDSIMNFQTIYTIPGICGGSSVAAQHDYLHLYPDINKKNYYRLFLPPSTYLKPIEADFASIFGDYTLFNHPLVSEMKIQFSNPTSARHIIEISHPLGYWVYRDEYVYSNSITLQASAFPNISGVFYFRIYREDGSNPIGGKFLLIRP